MIEIPKYPAVKVQLSGVDNNALAIMGAVSAALRRTGVSDQEYHAVPGGEHERRL